MLDDNSFVQTDLNKNDVRYRAKLLVILLGTLQYRCSDGDNFRDLNTASAMSKLKVFTLPFANLLVVKASSATPETKVVATRMA